MQSSILDSLKARLTLPENGTAAPVAAIATAAPAVAPKDDLAIPAHLQATPKASPAPVAPQPAPPVEAAKPKAPAPAAPEVKAPAAESNASDGGGDPPGDNQPEINVAKDRAKFMRAVRSFGSDEGKGANARVALAVQVTEAAHFGSITSAGDDAKLVYEAYLKGVAAAKGVSEVKMGSSAQQISKIGTFIKLGELTTIDGRKTVEKILHAYRDAREKNGGKPLSKSTYDALLAGARYQLQFHDELISDDMVTAAISPAPKDEKLEVDKLQSVYDSMERIRDSEETPCSEESKDMLETLMADVMTRITAMGGSSKMKKEQEKREKKEAEELAKLQKENAAIANKIKVE